MTDRIVLNKGRNPLRVVHGTNVTLFRATHRSLHDPHIRAAAAKTPLSPDKSPDIWFDRV
jgi:hypothetical protein